MTGADASETEVADVGTLRYAPREPVAAGGSTYAPWWQRVTALLIDVSAVLTATTTVAIPIFVLAGYRTSSASGSSGTLLSVLLLGSTLVLGGAYAIVLEGRTGQTWGKRALGIRVLAEDGSPCGYGRAASRELLGRVLIGGIAWVLVLPGLLSYLAALWDPARQTWHDKIGQTIVVRVTPPPVPDLTDAEGPLTLTA